MVHGTIWTGKFIALVGMDYSGKTTAYNKLKEDFPDALFVREPGGTPLGERLREIIKSEEFKDMPTVARINLFYAARAELVATRILPALREGRLVVADRFDACTYAYQVHGEQGMHLKELLLALREACVVYPDVEPDAYFFFDVAPEVALTRAESDPNRESDHFDRRGVDFRWRLRHGYNEFFSLVSVPKVVIKADRRPEEVYLQVKSELGKIFVPATTSV